MAKIQSTIGRLGVRSTSEVKGIQVSPVQGAGAKHAWPTLSGSLHQYNEQLHWVAEVRYRCRVGQGQNQLCPVFHPFSQDTTLSRFKNQVAGVSHQPAYTLFKQGIPLHIP